jgi:hypothetical protein
VTAHATTVNVLLGNGNGTFQAAVSSASVGSSGLVIADFDRDGSLDVVTSGGTSISFLRGNGTASLAASVSSNVGVATSLLVPGDVNRDGRLDLVTASGGLAFIPGNGNGTFGIGTNLGFGGSQLAVQDFNQDGRLDVVGFVNLGGIAVANGNGNGTFQTPVLYAVGLIPDVMATASMTRDGLPDLVIADQDQSRVGMLLGR